MKVKYYPGIIILLIGACLIACKSKKTKSTQVTAHSFRLTRYNMYDKKMVGKALISVRSQHIDSTASIKLYQQGGNLFTAKNYSAALDTLKRSVFLFPQVNTYFGIGLVLTEMQANAKGAIKKAELNEAMQAYQIAEYLKYQPVSELYYNMACVDNLLSGFDSVNGTNGISFHTNQAIFELRNAFENGFNDTARLQKDKYLNSILETDAYQELIAQLNDKKSADSVQAVFNSFIYMFPVLAQPYVITLNNIEQKGIAISAEDYSGYIPGMEATTFSRGVNHDYYAIGKIAETPKYVAVLYSETQFDDDEGGELTNFQPYSTILITYTPDGKVIDKMEISCRCTMESETTASIENNLISTQNYAITWQYSGEDMGNFQEQLYNAEAKAEEDKSADNDKKYTSESARQDSIDSNSVRLARYQSITNNITKIDTLDMKYFQVTDEGKIVSVDTPVKDSLNKSASSGNKGTQ